MAKDAVFHMMRYRPTEVENLARAGTGMRIFRMPGPWPGLTLVIRFLINMLI